jgi:hypothetical protein
MSQAIKKRNHPTTTATTYHRLTKKYNITTSDPGDPLVGMLRSGSVL